MVKFFFSPTPPRFTKGITFAIIGFISLIAILTTAIKFNWSYIFLPLACLVFPAYIIGLLGILGIRSLLVSVSMALGAVALVGTLAIQIERDWSPILLVFIAPTYIGLVVAATGYALKHRRDGLAPALLPLSINFSSVAIALSLGYVLGPLDLYFRWRLSGYTEVIRLVEEGHIQPDAYDFIDLPAEYAYLADGGIVEARHRDKVWSVFFCKTCGLLTSMDGYLYRSDGMPPTPKDYCQEWQPLSYSKWFFCEDH